MRYDYDISCSDHALVTATVTVGATDASKIPQRVTPPQ
jgi:hypothetical protein